MKNGGRFSGWRLCLAGLMVYLAVQGALLNLPLAGWTLLPELDDTLTYLLKTRQLQECPQQNCLALQDLQQQLFAPVSEPAAARHLDLARSRLFPVYHPLFSVILLGLSKTGLGLLEAYQWLWRLSPLIFGLAFLYLLVTLTEPAAAGLALALLAFKIFPDTGLHHLVPSNLAMAGAVIVWARILSRQGWAPWTLGLSALLLPAMHPVGVLYTLVSIGLALACAEPVNRRKVVLVITLMLLALGALFAVSWLVRGIFLVRFTIIPAVANPVTYMLSGAGQNLQTVIVEIIRSNGSLFGSAPFFLAAVVLGLLTLPPDKRRRNAVILVLNGLLLGGMLFYVSSHPGDVILRLWIPAVVILCGLVGQSFLTAARLSRSALADNADSPAAIDQGDQAADSPNKQQSAGLPLASLLPLLLLAALVGYGLQMAASGAEQVYTYIDFLRRRQPLALSAAQPQALLSQARTGDRVFYNSLILMPYYFIHGAMKLGAVYYNPALRGTPVMETWLRKPEVRFAVTYNPTVFHPSFAGVDEPRWWITSPSFRYSPLEKPRRGEPLAREGAIPMADYQWLELELPDPDFPRVLKVRVRNPGEASRLLLSPVSSQGEPLPPQRSLLVPARTFSWLELPLDRLGAIRRLRLALPPGAPPYEICGLVFGEDTLAWPWGERASLRARPRAGGAPDITVSFDPRTLLPPPLNQKRIKVLDDFGSSVLLRLD